jgi:hypothetical protein
VPANPAIPPKRPYRLCGYNNKSFVEADKPSICKPNIESKLDTNTNSMSPAVSGEKQSRPAGLEPATFGFEVRGTGNASIGFSKTYKSEKGLLTPQLTPKSQNQSYIDTKSLPADLAEVVAVWSELPEHIKAAIKALIHTHSQGESL